MITAPALFLPVALPLPAGEREQSFADVGLLAVDLVGVEDLYRDRAVPVHRVDDRFDDEKDLLAGLEWTGSPFGGSADLDLGRRGGGRL